MSWTPDFWIALVDYEKIKDQLPDHYAYRLDVGYCSGVHLSGGGTTRSFRDIDNVLELNKIIHWLTNGEGRECDYCIEYGERLNDFYENDDLRY